MEATAHDLTAVHICKHPNCTNEARSDRGPFSRCDEHRGTATTSPRRATPPPKTGLQAQLQGLTNLAKTADRLHARAEKLTRDALAAKREADEASAAFRAATRAALNEDA